MTSRITVEGVSKRYVKYDDAPLLVSRFLRLRAQRSRSELWALRDIGFEVAPGECVGVIGRNGSGKSTLLRLLAGVTAPTNGRVFVRGRVAPLLSVGVGFHQELTGRENVYVSGIILGLRREEIDARFDEIVEFADIGDFIDTPVKFYSSGMFVRLGFAVSILADPDVLLVDEVLAVGDLAFGLKSFDRMKEVKDAGASLVLVSHNLSAVRLMCDRTIVLHDGGVRHDGDTGEAISLFHDLLGEPRDPEAPSARELGSFQAVEEVAVLDRYEILDADGRPTGHVRAGDPLRIVMEATFVRPADDLVAGVNVFSHDGITVASDSSPWRATHEFVAGEQISVDVVIDTRLATGTYTVQLVLFNTFGTFATKVPRPLPFFVNGRDQVGGLADLDARFTVEVVDPPT